MIVPGFNNRYPRDGDDQLWSYADCRNDRIVIESCCTTLEQALSAQTRGADRIELCTDLAVGGVTPPRELIKEVVEALAIPVNVLIRPSTREALWHCLPERLASLDPSHAAHGPLPLTVPRVACLREAIPPVLDSRVEESLTEMNGFSFEDFVYDEADIEQMIADTEYCKSVGAAGIVVGALTPEGAIDIAAMRRLIAAAAPLPVTFHRAFDVCTQDPFDALETVIALGCTRLLTSGQAPTAWEGRALLKQLVTRAGDRLIVLIGRGVNSHNIKTLAAETGAREYHGTVLP